MQPNNLVVLEGYVTRQPTSKKVPRQDGTDFLVAETGIGVSKRIVKNGVTDYDTSFFDLIFRGTSVVEKLVTPFINKGTHISLVGELKQQAWTDQQGAKRSRVYVIVDSCKLLDKKQTDSQPQAPQNEAFTEELPPIDINDDEIPF